MTQQQKTIKLAAYSGDWTIKDWKESEGWYSIIVEDKNGKICEFKNNGYAKELQFIDLPEFFEDLNAVRKLEEKLTNDQWNRYIFVFLCQPFYRLKSDLLKTQINASAEEKCEALGKTINLWS